VPGGPAIYAHRLGAAYGPESGRSTLRRTLADPVDGVEADVVLSADEDVLALHDPALWVSTDLDGWANERDAAALSAARLLDHSGEPSDDRPMRLVELLEMLPSELPLQLDVKAYADTELAVRTARRCCEIARERGVASRVEVISFFSGACVAAVEEGLAARLVIWADYAPDALAEWLSEHGMRGISAEGFIVTPRLGDPLKAAGLTLSVGGINEGTQLERLLVCEPEIVVSDRPHEMRDMLAGRPAPG
jgi:glycerophosphoryl diester phosphodiesterase